MISIHAKVDADRATRQFKTARRDLNGRLRQALKIAGEKVALPAARVPASKYRVGGVPVAGTLQVKSTSRSAYLTTALRGSLGRAVGLLEFGGTVFAPIVPKTGRAVVVNGQPVARVDTPRTYQANAFLRTAVASREGKIGTTVRDEIMDVFLPEFEVD